MKSLWFHRLIRFVVAVYVLAVAGCAGGGPSGSGDVLNDLKQRGSVRIGIANEVPYGYQDDDGTVTGEAPEVAKAVLARMGITHVEPVVVDFGALIPALQAGQFDMIAAGMSITSERSRQVAFADPDYCMSNVFVVAKGNPRHISDYRTLIDSGARLAVLSGGTDQQWTISAGVPDDRMQKFSDDLGRYDALRSGRVDALVGTSLGAKAQVASTPDDVETTEPFFPTVDGNEQPTCGGFGFRDKSFRDAFNTELKKMQRDNSIDPIIKKFGFTQGDVDKAKSLTVADLIGQPRQ